MTYLTTIVTSVFTTVHAVVTGHPLALAVGVAFAAMLLGTWAWVCDNAPAHHLANAPRRHTVRVIS